jgi:hypothetical protein
MVGSVSPFHDIPEAEWIVSNASCFSIWDRFPVNPGLVTTWGSTTVQPLVRLSPSYMSMSSLDIEVTSSTREEVFAT